MAEATRSSIGYETPQPFTPGPFEFGSPPAERQIPPVNTAEAMPSTFEYETPQPLIPGPPEFNSTSGKTHPATMNAAYNWETMGSYPSVSQTPVPIRSPIERSAALGESSMFVFCNIRLMLMMLSDMSTVFSHSTQGVLANLPSTICLSQPLSQPSYIHTSNDMVRGSLEVYRNRGTDASIDVEATNCEHRQHRNHIEWYEMRLNQLKKILGSDYPNIEGQLYNIAQMLGRAEHRGTVPEWAQKAEEWFGQALLKHDNMVLVTYVIEGLKNQELLYTFGKICHCQGNYENALEWFLKALAIQRTSKGLEVRTADTMYSIGVAFYKRSDSHPSDAEDAKRWLKFALEIYDKVLPKNHDWTLMVTCLIGCACYQNGKYVAALKWLNRGLERRNCKLEAVVDPNPLVSLDTVDKAFRAFIRLRDRLNDVEGVPCRLEDALHSLGKWVVHIALGGNIEVTY